jgi:hypothetical protein
MVARTQAAMPMTSGRRDTLLRRALAGNVLFSTVSGIVLVLGSGRISDFTGLTPDWLPAAIGAGVLLWALEVALIARAEELRLTRVWMVIAGDAAWVVASYGFLLVGGTELTSAGAWTIGTLAEIVALFAVVQYLGLRRLRA